MSAAVRRINVPVAVIVTLISALYLHTTFYVVLPWLGSSLSSIVHLAVLSYTTISSIFLYFLCVLVDPGKVPENWRPDEEAHESIIQVKKKTGQHRFCQKCQSFKPPRCHHCRICERCILRMDHHCPWMNNCIGHRNYRAFISFLIFMLLTLMHHIGLMAAYQQYLVKQMQLEETLDDPSGFDSLDVLILVGCCLVWLVLLGLLFWHISLIACNKTTIEYYEGVHAKFIASQSGTFWRHPYDLGFAANFVALFGQARWKWLLPLARLEGDGLRHRTVIETHHE